MTVFVNPLAARVSAALLVLALLAAACSDDAQADLDPPAPEEAASIEADALIAAEDDVIDLLTAQPAFGFGLFNVNGESGQATQLAAPDGVSVVGLSDGIFLAGSNGYVLGLELLDGSAPSSVSVVRVDLTTGETSKLAEVAAGDAVDASIDYSIAAASRQAVVVRAGAFGSNDGASPVFDATSGEQIASFAEPRYRFDSEAGSCDGGIFDLTGTTSGLIGRALGSPAFLNPGSGEIDLLIECDEQIGSLGSFASADRISDYAAFGQGAAPTDAVLAEILQTDLAPQGAIVEGGGDLWWVVAEPYDIDNVPVIAGGLVQFDLASGQVEAVHSLGADLGRITNCPDSCTFQTLESAELRHLADRIVIVDVGDNGNALVVDPATGTRIAVPVQGDAGRSKSTLVRGDRNEVWIEVARFAQDDDEPVVSLERLDLSTGAITLSVPVADL